MSQQTRPYLHIGGIQATRTAFTPGFALDLARKQGAAIKNGLPGEFAMGTPRLKSDDIRESQNSVSESP